MLQQYLYFQEKGEIIKVMFSKQVNNNVVLLITKFKTARKDI